MSFEVNKKNLATIERLSSIGMTMEQIHNFFGLTTSKWYNLVRKNPKITKAFDKGKAFDFEFTEEFSQELQRLVTLKMTEEQIYNYLGFKASIWYELKNKHPKIQEIINEARHEKFVPDEKVLEEVKKLGGLGLNMEQVRQYFGITETVWYTRLKQFPEFKEAWEVGKAKNLARVGVRLMDLVEEKNVAATIFFLKTQGQFSERSIVEVKDQNKQKKPQIDLSLRTNDPVKASKIYQKLMSEGDCENE